MKKIEISSRPFILIINGPSCAGKSAIANVILEKCGNIFNAKSDHIKWLISDYQAEVHREIIHKMTLELIKIALKNNFSVLKEGNIFEPEKLTQIAKDFNTPLFIANVSAPDKVLEKRFLERKKAKKNGAKISNVSIKRFKEINKMYLDTKIVSPLEFDSSIKSSEQIALIIIKHIKSNLE